MNDSSKPIAQMSPFRFLWCGLPAPPPARCLRMLPIPKPAPMYSSSQTPYKQQQKCSPLRLCCKQHVCRIYFFTLFCEIQNYKNIKKIKTYFASCNIRENMKEFPVNSEHGIITLLFPLDPNLIFPHWQLFEAIFPSNKEEHPARVMHRYAHKYHSYFFICFEMSPRNNFFTGTSSNIFPSTSSYCS